MTPMTEGQKMVWAAAYAVRLRQYGDEYPSADIMHMAAEYASMIVGHLVERAPSIIAGHGADSDPGRMTKAMVEE